MNSKGRHGPSTAERMIATTLLVAASPVLAVSALWVALTDGLPVLFKQTRAGRHGTPFEVVKLRTMRKDLPPPDEVGQVQRDNPYVLPLVGSTLRRLKLDEVPQLLNVVRGEMRFVGPRPALIDDVGTYSELERQRLLVSPGLTGWAQVNGNTQLSWRDRICLDLYYVDHRDWALDLRIVFMTLGTIFAGERVNERNLKEARRHASRLTGRSSID